MNHFIKTTLAVLGVGLCGAIIYLVANLQNRLEVKKGNSVFSHNEMAADAPLVISVPTNIVQSKKVVPSVTVTNTVISAIVEKSSEKSFMPVEIGYKAGIHFQQGDVLLSIMNAVSNAVLSVDRDLKSQHYRDVKQFNRTVWLESIDKAQSIEWRVIPVVRATPEGTNIIVGGIKAIVYHDVGMTQKDPSRSFQMDLYPETGALRSFWWDDKHEVLKGRSDLVSVDYSRKLGGEKSMVMVWDGSGVLVSSNVYDWANRGRAISGWTVTNTPIYDDTPIHKTRSKF